MGIEKQGRNLEISELKSEEICLVENGHGLYGVVSTEFGPQWYLVGVAGGGSGPSYCHQSVRFYSTLHHQLHWILDTIAMWN